MKSDKIYQILLMTFFGMFGSILVGFIFFNDTIFHTTNSNFQFVADGLYGALFFSLLEYTSIREQIYGMIFMFFLQRIIFIGIYLSMAYVIRDLLYLGSLFLSIKLYYQFIIRNPKIKYYLRSFALVLFFGLMNILFISIVYIINAKAGLPPLGFIYFVARSAILIGFGLGIGIDFFLQNKRKLSMLLKIKIE